MKPVDGQEGCSDHNTLAGDGIGLSSLGQGGAGSGGALGGSRPGIVTPGVFAAGGAGIVGANLDITNSGGLSGDGSTRAAAVLFTGGANNSLNVRWRY